MADDTSAELQALIDRLRCGDATARRELLERAHDRLMRIAARIFHDDFPGLHGRHELESVVSEVWMRLVVALESTAPETVEGFIGLVFVKVRQVLLDMAQGQRRADARRQEAPIDGDESGAMAGLDASDTTHDPRRLALLTEFHEQVGKLPDEQRIVFDLHYYGGYSQAEIARMLEVHRKQVSRLWLAATGRLAHWLDGSIALL